MKYITETDKELTQWAFHNSLFELYWHIDVHFINSGTLLLLGLRLQKKQGCGKH
jgi:hypothetical protein